MQSLNNQAKYNLKNSTHHSRHKNTHFISVWSAGSDWLRELGGKESESLLAGRNMTRASISWTFPPLLSSSALRELWPEGGENKLDDRVVKSRTNTQYSVF